MVKKDITVKIQEGIDVEYAGKLAIAAERFQSMSTLTIRNNAINMRSLLNLVSVGIRKGDVVKIVCEGPEEAAAMKTFENILTGRE